MKNYVSKIYENREKFIIIGLTGKTGSGCTTISKILKDGYKDYNEVDCNDKPINNRKNSIVKAFASKAFKDKKFQVIRPSTLMMMLFVFEKQILFGRIKPLKKMLDKTEDEIKKLDDVDLKKFQEDIKNELKILKELLSILTIFNELKGVESFKDFESNFNEKLDYSKMENRKKLSLFINNEKIKYEDKLLQQNKNDLLEEINKLFSCRLKMKFFNKIKQTETYAVINRKIIDKEIIKTKIEQKRIIIDEVLNYLAKNKSKDFIKLYEKYNET